MPRPTSATTIQRPVLNQLFIEYMDQVQTQMAGLQCLPIFNTPKREPDVPVMPREALLKFPGDLKREARAAYNRGDWEFETMTLRCEEYGYEEPVDDVERAMYSDYFSADEMAMKRAADHLLRNQENIIEGVLFNATTFASYTTAVSNEWSSAANGTPLADVKTAIQSLRGKCGLNPTDIVFSLKVFENLMLSAKIKDYLQYTSPHLLLGFEAKRQMLSSIFGLNVIVAGAVYDSAKEGQATVVADIWDDEYALLFVKSTGDLRSPGLGRTFLWTDDSPQNLNVESYREEQTRGDIIRVRQHTVSKILKPEYGWLLSNISA